MVSELASKQERLFQLERRSTRRVAQRGDVVLHTELGRRPGRLLEYSPHGASALLEVGAVRTGTVVDAELTFGGTRTCARARVKHVGPSEGAALVALEFQDSQERVSIASAYLRRRFPRLVARGTIARDEIVGLVVSAGYSGLRGSSEGVSSEWPPRERTHRFSHDVVYVGDDSKPLGHVSVSRSHRRTWLAHGLAARWGHGGCWRDLCLFASNVPRCFDGGEAILMAYYNKAKPWNQTLFESFSGVGNPFAACVSLDRFERIRGSEPTIPLQQGITVRRITGAERVAAAAFVRASVPALLAEAWDVTDSRIEFSGEHLTASSGTGRARQAFVAMIDGRIVGVALCETGDRGASLFDIFNSAFVFLRPGVEPRTAAALQRALLGSVYAYFEGLGTPSPLIIAPQGTLAADAGDLRFEETMGCVVMTGTALRHWENFIHLLWG